MEVMEGKTAFKDYYNSDLRPKQAEKGLDEINEINSSSTCSHG